MQPYPYTPGALAGLLKALSEPRFQTYLGHANGDQEMGMRQYVWNGALASGLHGPVHMLEVTLRNAVHDRLKHIHGASWSRHTPRAAPPARCAGRSQHFSGQRQ